MLSLGTKSESRKILQFHVRSRLSSYSCGVCGSSVLLTHVIGAPEDLVASRLLLRPQISSNFQYISLQYPPPPEFDGLVLVDGGGGAAAAATAAAAAAAALLLLFSSCGLLNQFCHPSLIKYTLSNSKTFELYSKKGCPWWGPVKSN